MMYVLDTNVVSELRKVRLGKADANVTAWTESVDAADLFVSAITVMELELDVLSIERKDATQGAMLRTWLEQHVLPEFSGRTLPVDTATALVHGMTVVTRNVADFKLTGVTVVNPWEAQ